MPSLNKKGCICSRCCNCVCGGGGIYTTSADHAITINQDGLISIDGRGIITKVNDCALDIFGYTRAELIGKSVTKLIAKEHLAEYERIMNASKTTEFTSFDGTYLTGLSKKKKEIDVAVKGTVLFDNPDRPYEPTGFAIMVRDIEGGLHGKEINKSQLEGLIGYVQEMSSIDERAPLIEYIVEAGMALTNARMVSFNVIDIVENSIVTEGLSSKKKGIIAQVMASSGYRNQKMMIPLEKIQGELIEHIRNGEILERDSIYDVSFGMIPKTACKVIDKALGVEKLFIISAMSEADLVGIMVFYFDEEYKKANRELIKSFASMAGIAFQKIKAIEDLKRLSSHLKEEVDRQTEEIQLQNQELVASNIKIREANEMKNEFIINMSHELRTPLNAILGFSQVLLSGDYGKLDDMQTGFMNDIYRAGDHLLKMINDMLDLSKLERGKFEISAEPINVVDIVDSVRGLMEPVAANAGITGTYAVARGIKMITADELRLKQVLTNLITNAIKFNKPGGSFTVSVTKDKDGIMFDVTDTGIGIDEKDHATIFEKFRQIDGSTTRVQEGAGLGLSITKHLVELHGGHINVRSTPGKGSSFYFTIPKAKRSNAKKGGIAVRD